jgi:hypothetical protein
VARPPPGQSQPDARRPCSFRLVRGPVGGPASPNDFEGADGDGERRCHFPQWSGIPNPRELNPRGPDRHEDRTSESRRRGEHGAAGARREFRLYRSAHDLEERQKPPGRHPIGGPRFEEHQSGLTGSRRDEEEQERQQRADEQKLQERAQAERRRGPATSVMAPRIVTIAAKTTTATPIVAVM